MGKGRLDKGRGRQEVRRESVADALQDIVKEPPGPRERAPREALDTTQAIDYGIDPTETERYIAYPGQACAYMIGQLRIVAQREKARAAMGSKVLNPRIPQRGAPLR